MQDDSEREMPQPTAEEDQPVTDEQVAELDRRREAYLENPEIGSSWEEVKQRIRLRSG